ncbi:armadillo-type protein [Chytridium lagenaria]|nr:armadillo-type protein [Chytridium lagenaria]
MDSLQVMLQTLSRAVAVQGGDVQDRAAAESQLKSWEGAPGYYISLLEISSREDVPFPTRHLAALNLKNGVDKYWRKKRPKPDEKAKIRMGLSSLMSNESKSLSKAYGEALAKIARLDFPNEWPNLLDTLTQKVRQTFELPTDEEPTRRYLLQRHTMYIFHRVIKLLYSMQLAHHKRLHYEITPGLFKYFSSLFIQASDAFFGCFTSANGTPKLVDMDGNIEVARFSFKCLRSLICFGYPEKTVKELGNKPCFHEVEDAMNVFSNIPSYLGKMLQYRQTLLDGQSSWGRSPYIDSSIKAIQSLCLSMGKMYRDLQSHRFVNFCLASSSLDVVRFYWQNVSSYYFSNSAPPTDPFYEKILLQSIHMVRVMITATELDVAQGAQRHPNCDQAIERLQSQIWTPDFLISALNTLVLKVIQLTPDDLSSWQEEPEIFLENESNESYEFSIRLSAQTTVYEMAKKRHRDALAPVLLTFLQQVSDISAKADVASILLKDAVYASFGICADPLFSYVDFDGWFEKTLVHEVDPDSTEMGDIINRRVCFLISSWCNVKMSPRLLPTIYNLLITLALPGKDLVLRLTAITALRDVIGESHQEVQAFLPFADTAINLLLQTIPELEEYETRVLVLGCLTTVITHLGSQIVSKVALIGSKIPGLWDLSELQPMLRISIMSLLKEMIQSLQAHSIELHGLVLPIIRMSFESNETTTYIEDTLDLWLAFARHSPEMTSGLFDLLVWMEHIFDLSSEYLRTALKVLESYFLLSPAAVFQVCHRQRYFVWSLIFNRHLPS